jgi:hypothetical protein
MRKLHPGLHKVSRRFGAWLQQFERVLVNGRCGRPEWDDHLEGTTKNYDPPIFALPSGRAALNSGQYFVAWNDTEPTLDKLCRQLRLRGVQCGDRDDR